MHATEAVEIDFSFLGVGPGLQTAVAIGSPGKVLVLRGIGGTEGDWRETAWSHSKQGHGNRNSRTIVSHDLRF